MPSWATKSARRTCIRLRLTASSRTGRINLGEPLTLSPPPDAMSRSFAPDLREDAQPVLAQYATDLSLRPPGLLHRPREIWKVADRANTLRVSNGLEVDELARIAFVMGQPIEEGLVLVLSEI